MKGKKHMKTVAMESFCVLEVILCRVVALPILFIAFLGFILGEKIFRRQFKHLHLTSPLAVISSVYISMLLPAGVRGEPKAAF